MQAAPAVPDSPADEADPDATPDTQAGTAPARAVGNPRGTTRRAAPALVDPNCTAADGLAKGASFGRDDRLVMTYYYYWYDQASLEDLALSQHPPNDPPVDWRSVAWHERQLADMASAGVDVALVVYWGDTSDWSIKGLAPMVQARENLLAAGLRPPAIGLFFDTNLYATILPERPELSDLTTDDGLGMLAHQVSAYLDQVPPCHRARVDGRPLAFFWRSDTEDGDHFTFDDRTFAGLEDLIAADYGEHLHFVLEHSWQTAARKAGVELGAGDRYRWGAALNGPRFEGRTVAIGPGYDDRNIGGRPGYTRERVDGITYSRDLRLAVLSGSQWLLLETWNEMWEGTAIAETDETGRTYLGITARYTALFHQLADERARDGWMDLGNGQTAYLRRLADFPTEQGTPAHEADRWGARPLREDDDGTGYFHFAVDRRLSLAEPRPLSVEVEYFDEGDGSFLVEYDSLDPDAPEDGAYKPTSAVTFENTRRWRTHRFELPDISYRSRQYDGAGDFRIHDIPGEDGQLHAYGRVTITPQPAARPILLAPESLSFFEPTSQQNVGLRWSPVPNAAGYLVVIQPFDVDPATVADTHGYTNEERQRCNGDGDADVEAGDQNRALSQATTCELRLSRDLAEGLYRWRVQPLDNTGSPVGEPGDWAYFVAAHR